MNLLPKAAEEFSSKTYWDNFFTGRGKDSFEWYGEYSELCGILHQYMRPAEDVLVAGCGSSSLSADLCSVGYRGIVNVDVSPVVIKQMQAKYGTAHPSMQWRCEDLTASSLQDASFSVVLDKGTLDALFTDDS